MYINGIVIQKYADIAYRGIDGSGFSDKTGENWYFNNHEQLSDIFEPYYDEHINLTYYNLPKHSRIAACNDIEYIKKYIRESEKQNIKFRLILCESDIPNPIMNDLNFERKFLGYDYAYALGDNYSAVYSEIPGVFPQFSLNCNGLFETAEEICRYIVEREKFKKSHPPYTLEEGDFAVFRLSELYL